MCSGQVLDPLCTLQTNGSILTRARSKDRIHIRWLENTIALESSLNNNTRWWLRNDEKLVLSGPMTSLSDKEWLKWVMLEGFFLFRGIYIQYQIQIIISWKNVDVDKKWNVLLMGMYFSNTWRKKKHSYASLKQPLPSQSFGISFLTKESKWLSSDTKVLWTLEAMSLISNGLLSPPIPTV